MEPLSMDMTFVQWLINQGLGVAFGFVVTGGMFWVYRKDSMLWGARRDETAAAFMAFGEKYATAAAQQALAMAQQATALTHNATAMTRQAEILDRIERHLTINARQNVPPFSPPA